METIAPPEGLTRRHFEWLAAVLADLRLSANMDSTLYVMDWNSWLESFADDLALSNPRFDKARFLKAAGHG